MAVTKTVLKLSERDAVIKAAGSDGSVTFGLATDLKLANEFMSGTPHVSISGVQWTGTTSAVVTIVRNSVTIMTLNCGAAGALEMTGQMMIPDDIQGDQDIVVNVTGAGEVWIRLKKVAGYNSGSETSVFGQYDDPARIGASTTIPGSPDYVAP